MDSLTKEARSQLMSRVRGRGNKSTELVLVHCLRRGHLHGWRRHVQMLGTPDFVFRKGRLCVFVDGCFWHGCPKCYRPPKSQKRFWSEKVQRNRKRDKRITRELTKVGWRVLRIRECQLKTNPDRCLKRIGAALTAGLERIRRTPTTVMRELLLHPKSKPLRQPRKP
jgi:DNA mismatch endonuclease (patch repair protein)